MSIYLTAITAVMTTFDTKYGQYVFARPVQSAGGPQAGRWQIRISGQGIDLKCGYKCLYSDPNHAAVVQEVAHYLEVDVVDLVELQYIQK